MANFFPSGATFSNETPGEVTDRPTEVSITKTEFGWPKPVLKGDEALPVRIAPGSERYTGKKSKLMADRSHCDDLALYVHMVLP